MMFSRTVRSGTRPSVLRFSEQNATPAPMASLGALIETCLPAMLTLPLSGWSAPNSSRASSLRPEPSSPARPSTSPFLISRSKGAIPPARPRPSALRSVSPTSERIWCSWSSSSWSRALPIISSISPTWSRSATMCSPTRVPLRSTVMRSQIS